MKNVPKKLLVIALTVFLVFGSIFCCCLGITPHAQASNIEVNSSDSHCHSSESNNANNSETEDCECHYSNAILANLNLDLIKSDLSLVKLFKETFHFNVSFSRAQSDSSLHFDHSPPLLYRRCVPLYLENSILRI